MIWFPGVYVLLSSSDKDVTKGSDSRQSGAELTQYHHHWPIYSDLETSQRPKLTISIFPWVFTKNDSIDISS